MMSRYNSLNLLFNAAIKPPRFKNTEKIFGRATGYLLHIRKIFPDECYMLSTPHSGTNLFKKETSEK